MAGLQRYPGAIWVPGEPNKVGYVYGTPAIHRRTAPKRGVVTHSAEGWANQLKEIVQGTIRRASWTFSLLLDGTTLQHYDVDTNCWHGGDADSDDNVRANIDLEGWEFEGVEGTPINGLQVTRAAELYRWHQVEHGWGPYRLWQTVYEHNWVSDDPTACPSNRIRHADIAALTLLPVPKPTPETPAEVHEEDEVGLVLVKATDVNAIYLTDWIEARRVTPSVATMFRYMGVPGVVTVAKELIPRVG